MQQTQLFVWIKSSTRNIRHWNCHTIDQKKRYLRCCSLFCTNKNHSPYDVSRLTTRNTFTSTTHIPHHIKHHSNNNGSLKRPRPVKLSCNNNFPHTPTNNLLQQQQQQGWYSTTIPTATVSKYDKFAHFSILGSKSSLVTKHVSRNSSHQIAAALQETLVHDPVPNKSTVNNNSNHTNTTSGGSSSNSRSTTNKNKMRFLRRPDKLLYIHDKIRSFKKQLLKEDHHRSIEYHRRLQQLDQIDLELGEGYEHERPYYYWDDDLVTPQQQQITTYQEDYLNDTAVDSASSNAGEYDHVILSETLGNTNSQQDQRQQPTSSFLSSEQPLHNHNNYYQHIYYDNSIEEEIDSQFVDIGDENDEDDDDGYGNRNVDMFLRPNRTSTDYNGGDYDIDDKVQYYKYRPHISEQDEKEASSNTYLNEQQQNEPAEEKEKTLRECFDAFDPQNPPLSNDYHEYQLWLECESHHETATRFQKVIDEARLRNDYSALSKVQRQIVQWFGPLQEDILKKQRMYIYKEDGDAKEHKTNKNDVSDTNDRKRTKNKIKVRKHTTRNMNDATMDAMQLEDEHKLEVVEEDDDVGRKIDLSVGRNKYGPLLCALPPKKLAIIVAHEAICHILLRMPSRQEGVPFISIAKRIGEAVEEEVAIQRTLYKRFTEQQKKNKNKSKSTAENEEEQNDDDNDDEDDVTNVNDSHNNTLHMKSFVDNVSNLFNDDDSVSSKMLESDLIDDDEHNLFGSDEIEDGTDTNGRTSSTTITSTNSRNSKEVDQEKLKLHRMKHWSYAASHLKAYLNDISKTNPTMKKRRVIRYAIKRAKEVLERDEEWTVEEKIQLGTVLFHSLLETATINDAADGTRIASNAFIYEKRWTSYNRTQTFVRLHTRMYDKILHDRIKTFGIMVTRFKPMIVEPKPWTSHLDGGYKVIKSNLLRYHGSKLQKEVLFYADLTTVMNGLNVLGRVKWKINKNILSVAQQCWEQNIPLGDIPSRKDYDLPKPVVPPTPYHTYGNGNIDRNDETWKQYLHDKQLYREAEMKFQRIVQKNMDLNSLRCSAILKLDQAEKFKEFDSIYFPYNMDFRGRAYPIPPHLSNVGSDLCRGILYFAESKPLGQRGLYWLKVHLANFAGMDKISFQDRANFVDEHIDTIRQCVNDPFQNRWWMSLEDPFQGLATCYEIIAAIDSGDPTTYMCSLPVHMDGSCNGLQHYAALGRDQLGGTAVNLCPVDTPQDVYVGVMEEVIKRVQSEAERTNLGFDIPKDLSTLSKEQKRILNDHRSAKLVNGLIDRGVVKRTVMTSVYGVTYIGAKQQIREKIEDKLEAQGYDLDEKNQEIFQACGYLAKVTMDTIGDLFSGAKGTMNWLTTCARKITQHGYPVAWISPIGLPIVQPYRQKKAATLVTLLQTVTLLNENEDLPIHKTRQVSAFPPNFIHSLDSSHMLLTALEMEKRQLTFSAVHDSFWTHPCDVDEMSTVLRSVFVDLYSQPILENLKETWELRYPGIEFPDLPERGTLDLNDVKRAPYFFQ